MYALDSLQFQGKLSHTQIWEINLRLYFLCVLRYLHTAAKVQFFLSYLQTQLFIFQS